ncbi:MAG: hypothetical protein PHP03_00225 [Candidatus Pacebacteria bacterium]|nr:hypothetical protein [Candidatus Paceibacterota bacterium]
MKEAINISIKFLVDNFLHIRSFFGNILGEHYTLIITISLILTALFVWGFLNITLKSGWYIFKMEDYMDKYGIGNLFRTRAKRIWKKVKVKISSQNSADWKEAITDTDRLFNDFLKYIGYLGANLENKLKNITAEQIPNLEEIKKAHDLTLKIKNEADLVITQAEALEALRSFKKAFVDLKLF